MLNLATVLDYSVKDYADKTALVFGDKRFSYAQLNAVACQVANGLADLGIGKGDKGVVRLSGEHVVEREQVP